MKSMTLFGVTVDFNEIPQYPRSNWSVDISWRDILGWVEKQISGEGLDLAPDFQRGHVWTTEQRIRYVEHVLRGGETGKDLSFNRPGWSFSSAEGPYQILDGLQRLTAAMMFMRGELPAFGRRVGEFTGHPRMWVSFRWRVFELPTRADVLRYYLDMNAGGTPHAESEIERVRALLAKETG
jgi:hypothetical protein